MIVSPIGFIAALDKCLADVEAATTSTLLVWLARG